MKGVIVMEFNLVNGGTTRLRNNIFNEDINEILDFLQIPIFITINDNIIVYGNEMFFKTLGKNFREFRLNLNMWDIFCECRKKIALEEDIYKVKDKESYVIVKTKELYIGNQMYVLNIVEDCTCRVELLEKNKEVEESLRFNKYKSEFLVNISHELKTPLNIILASIQLLEKTYENGASQYNKILKKYLSTMKQNSYRLVKLINNLIDLNKIDAGFLTMNFKKHDVVKVFEDITLSVVNYAELKDINLIFDTNIEELYAYIDADNMERVLLNLLSNAIKHTESGGHIYVTLKYDEENFKIYVRDTGSGIEEKLLNNIFEKYIQGSSSFNKIHSSGVGLSLVKHIVEAHKGYIEVESEVGVGSNFIVTIPIIDRVEVRSEPNIIRERNVEIINIEFSDIY